MGTGADWVDLYNILAFNTSGSTSPGGPEAFRMGSPVPDTYAVRPALYVKKPRRCRKRLRNQVAFGGQWWYVVGQGKRLGARPENTVTLFENPWEKTGRPARFGVYFCIKLSEKVFCRKRWRFSAQYLNLAGKESSLIVPRTLTSADGINGQTAHDQPFWPLSKDEADRTDAENPQE